MQQIRQADKYQTVLFESVRYSVPRQVAFEPVTVKAYVDLIVLVHKGQVVAQHRRSRTPGEQILEPTHFLAVLERKPAYLDHSKLFKELRLPAAFAQLRQRLNQDLGERAGTRHYIRVMQLLGRHTAAEVAVAIEACLPRQTLRAEFIEQKLTRSGATLIPADPLLPVPEAVAGPADQAQAADANVLLPTAQASVSVQVHVPRPDLRRFDLLLSDDSNLKGATDDVTSDQRGDVIEAQPQGAAAANDAERVCPALP
ncbi:MAG: Mu transposase domain-containing protein [Bacillota bacterium]